MAKPARIRPIKIRGFTLIELAITLAIGGILAAVAIPSMVGAMRSNSVKSRAASLQADISYARNEASRRRATISLCPIQSLADITTGEYTCMSTATDWSNGWLIYSGPQKTGNKLDANQVLKVRNDVAGIAISIPSSSGIAGAKLLSLNQLGGAKQTGVFTICPTGTTGSPGLTIEVLGSGSVNSNPVVCS
jgi:type IV fimbrial biogenesis protein FimT